MMIDIVMLILDGDTQEVLFRVPFDTLQQCVQQVRDLLPGDPDGLYVYQCEFTFMPSTSI